MTTQSQSEAASPAAQAEAARQTILKGLDGRHVVLVGLMGAGKTAMGRAISSRLGLPFIDSDDEIETASTMAIAELFQAYGESEFRDLERRVIARLLGEQQRVISLGGGAFVNDETRQAIAGKAFSIWIDADLDLLFARVSRKPGRPLLQNPDPRGTLARLMDERYPIYARADLHVRSEDLPRDAMAAKMVEALAGHFGKQER
ncbi:shikimate kinase [Notoacmeibacter sp. MSK16QG-6]|uniref:shikimate kinase n=1 Tax=Notoacmeibacter sp. MSK16QG-6 TaxID=2957982 RepID=UPI00209CD5A6|nr:shikimate kinase [Notoacmeibacter sp. MSK16QG-6]MCP1200010.1 shikimate kinase [Notoacmeibacter sp. MSK16QG-6]